MSTDDRIQEIVASGVIVTLPLDFGEDMLPIAEAIQGAGAGAVEVIPASLDLLDAIGQVRARLGRRLLLGVGGVVGGDAAWEVIRAGAAFVGSPHLDPEVLRFCREEEVPALPSALTPTEIAHAWDLGAGLVKIYPAGAMGPDYVRLALRGIPPLQAVAAGSVSVERVKDFIQAGVAAVNVEIEAARDRARGDPGAIARQVQAYLEAVQRAREQRVGPVPAVRPVEGPDVR